MAAFPAPLWRTPQGYSKVNGPGLVERSLHRVISLLQFTLLAGLLICAGYQSHYIFFKALYFRIREVQVQGNRALSQREIVRLSGLELGDLFFKYNYEKVKKRILANPRIEEARVVIRSPNAVEIQLKERQPAFHLMDGGTVHEVDRQGIVLGPKETVAGLPVLKGATLVPGPTGPQLEAEQQALMVQWVALLSRGPLKSFTELNISSRYRLEIRWKDHVVLAADPTTFEKNAAMLERAMNEAADRGKVANTLDLRFSHLVMKVSDAPAPAGKAN
jgi:cell division septal protein FtsQ